MHLTLFVPDLLWPDHTDRRAFEFEQATPLARLLFLSKHTAIPFSPISSWQSVLAETFGITDNPPPLGAIRLLGETHSPLNNAVGRKLLCADPVNLDFIQQALVLSKPEDSQLDTTEAELLLAALNEEFAGEGHFFTNRSTKHWYFQPTVTDAELPNLAACSRLLGRRIDADESRQILGCHGLRWMNRIQMCLNDHPINNARQLRGLPAINSVWPWGSGILKAEVSESITPLARVMGDNPLLHGLCLLTSTPHVPEFAADQPGLIFDSSLTEAVAHDDLISWQSAINTLVKVRLAPGLEALSRGKLSRMTLIAPDAYQTHYWTLGSDHKRLKPTFFQRCLGSNPKIPALASLVDQW